MRWGTNVVISRAMVEEVDEFPWQDITSSFKVPFRIIVPVKGEIPDAKGYQEKAKVENDLVSIKGASHYFDDNPEIREQLFRITKDWFDKYI